MVASKPWMRRQFRIINPVVELKRPVY